MMYLLQKNCGRCDRWGMKTSLTSVLSSGTLFLVPALCAKLKRGGGNKPFRELTEPVLAYVGVRKLEITLIR